MRVCVRACASVGAGVGWGVCGCVRGCACARVSMMLAWGVAERGDLNSIKQYSKIMKYVPDARSIFEDVY